jgi:hypothetical protein
MQMKWCNRIEGSETNTRVANDEEDPLPPSLSFYGEPRFGPVVLQIDRTTILPSPSKPLGPTDSQRQPTSA